MSQRANLHNITFKVGANYNLSIVYRGSDKNPIDLTGCSYAMQIRDGQGQEVLADLSQYISNTNPTNGEISLQIPYQETDQFAFKRASYDLIVIYSDDTVERILQGTCFTNSKITEVPNV